MFLYPPSLGKENQKVSLRKRGRLGLLGGLGLLELVFDPGAALIARNGFGQKLTFNVQYWIFLGARIDGPTAASLSEPKQGTGNNKKTLHGLLGLVKSTEKSEIDFRSQFLQNWVCEVNFCNPSRPTFCFRPLRVKNDFGIYREISFLGQFLQSESPLFAPNRAQKIQYWTYTHRFKTCKSCA